MKLEGKWYRLHRIANHHLREENHLLVLHGVCRMRVQNHVHAVPHQVGTDLVQSQHLVCQVTHLVKVILPIISPNHTHVAVARQIQHFRGGDVVDVRLMRLLQQLHRKGVFSKVVNCAHRLLQNELIRRDKRLLGQFVPQTQYNLLDDCFTGFGTVVELDGTISLQRLPN